LQILCYLAFATTMHVNFSKRDNSARKYVNRLYLQHKEKSVVDAIAWKIFVTLFRFFELVLLW